MTGSRIQVVTSLGILLFDYEPHSTKGEALQFINPPFNEEYSRRENVLLTPT